MAEFGSRCNRAAIEASEESGRALGSLRTEIIKVPAWADIDANPVDCPQGHTPIERGAKGTGAGYWCGQCQMRYVYEITSDNSRVVEHDGWQQLATPLKVVRSKDVMEALSAAFNSIKHQTLSVPDVACVIYKKLLDVPEFYASGLRPGLSEKDTTSSYETTTNEYSHEDVRDRDDERQYKDLIMPQNR